MKTQYSRRELYALGEPLGEAVTRKEGGRVIYGGGGASDKPQKSEVTQTNIPEYARPYVETMLGAGQQQIFNYEPEGDVYEDVPIYGPPTGRGGQRQQIGTEKKLVSSGNMVPTSIKPYQAFSQDPSKYFAGFSPMQEQSFQGAANLGVAPQLAGATGMAAEAGMRGLDTRYQTGRFDAPLFGGMAAQQYMNPYMQNVVDIQQREAQRQADIAGTQRGAQAVQSGAFGGSRQAIMDAEAARNLATQKGDIQAQGLNQSYQQAQQQFNADMARRQQAQQLYEQSRQYGSGLGLQGLQTGLQAAGQLGQLGQTQYGQNVGNIQLQNQLGGQQQQLEQAKINQQVQDYATAQQYPMLQLANMNNLLRGLPMQSTTTQTYQAPPSMLSQLGGLGATAYGAYKTFGSPGGAKGGSAKDIKKRPAGLAELALMKMQ